MRISTIAPRAALLAIAVFASALSAAHAQASVTPEAAARAAWDRARADWARGEAYKPGRFVIVSSEYERSGERSALTELEYRLSYAGGRETSAVVRAVRNGEDILDKTRADMDAAAAKAERRGSSGREDQRSAPSPFSPDAAATLGAPRDLPGGHELPFEFVADKARYRGTARFDAAWNPVSAVSEALSPPPMVKSLSMTFTFSRLPDGALVASRLVMEAEVDALVIRKRFLASMDFSEYARAP